MNLQCLENSVYDDELFRCKEAPIIHAEPRWAIKWIARHLTSIWLVGGLLVTVVLLIGAFVGNGSSSSPNARTDATYVTKNIEDLVVGDLVLAEDPETGEKCLRKVLDTYKRTVDHLQIVTLRGDENTGQTIRTTDEHPFWVEKTGWMNAGKLKVGQKVRQINGKSAIVTSNVFEPHPDGIAVFNCQVEGFHTYFVASDGIRGPPVLVHNNGPCDELIQLGLRRTTSQNARILGRNMAREGRAVGSGQAAAHIVASTGSKGHWAAAAESREILFRYRIDINDAANGIPLGYPRPHNITHSGEFHRSVLSRLQGVVNRMRASNYGHRAIRSALRRELRAIGREVLQKVK